MPCEGPAVAVAGRTEGVSTWRKPNNGWIKIDFDGGNRWRNRQGNVAILDAISSFSVNGISILAFV